MGNKVTISLRGKRGKVDGYAEMVLGVFALSGVLLSHNLSKDDTGQDETIFIDCELRNPPLGNLGTEDIPKRK